MNEDSTIKKPSRAVTLKGQITKYSKCIIAQKTRINKMAKGIERKIDELGRITIPKQMRTALGAGEKVKLGMYVKNNILYLFVANDDFVGFARNLDELGRWTIPIETRRSLNCSEGQIMDIYVELSDVFENVKTICISKPGCSWCDSSNNIINIKGHMLCGKCAANVIDEVNKKMLAHM
jgi:bifunctional DNA-binding transcriptional regulator/antitoxin component of YhaV-PrlF toxin-antitoxin module